MFVVFEEEQCCSQMYLFVKEKGSDQDSDYMGGGKKKVAKRKARLNYTSYIFGESCPHCVAIFAVWCNLPYI